MNKYIFFLSFKIREIVSFNWCLKIELIWLKEETFSIS